MACILFQNRRDGTFLLRAGLIGRLISKGRHEEALRSLTRLRTHAASNPTALESELALMEEVESNQKKAQWKEMFSRRNRVRTGVAVGAMLGQQLTGQAFFSQYSTFFYKQEGYSNPFLLSVIGSIVGVAFGIVAMFLVDHVGRRYPSHINFTDQDRFC